MTRRARRRRRRSARFLADSETDLGGTLAGSHTPWIQSAATCRLRNARRQSEKRPWDSPGAFSYTIGALQMHLECSLAVFLGYVLVFTLSLFDFRANAALNRLSEAFRLSQTGDFRAIRRLSATLGARLPPTPTPSASRRLRLPATPRLSDSQRLSTFDPRLIGALLPRSEIQPGMPERRAAVTIARAGAATIPRVVEERAAGRGKSTPKRRACIWREK